MVRCVVDLNKALQLISAHQIGDPVTIVLEDGRARLNGHVRAVTFTSGKVRYSIMDPTGATTLRNVDSAFVQPWPDGPNKRDELVFDNYD